MSNDEGERQVYRRIAKPSESKLSQFFFTPPPYEQACESSIWSGMMNVRT